MSPGSRNRSIASEGSERAFNQAPTPTQMNVADGLSQELDECCGRVRQVSNRLDQLAHSIGHVPTDAKPAGGTLSGGSSVRDRIGELRCTLTDLEASVSRFF